MKYLTTVRLNPEDYESVRLLSKRRRGKKADILRQAIHNGLIHLINGAEEDTLLAKRLSQKGADVDGPSFITRLKRELGL